MAVVNIPRDVTDAFYRYKMPALVAKVEGRGNGIKTVIVNMAEIAKSLDRPPSFTTKYFGFELGALTTIDPEKDRFIVNGKHDQATLAKTLDNFIEKFVLCKKCDRNPETKMLIRAEAIILHCIACGNRTNVDMRQKLASYILKNASELAGADDGASKKDKKKAAKKTKKGSSSDDEDTESSPEEEKPSKTPSKSKKKPTPTKDDDSDGDADEKPAAKSTKSSKKKPTPAAESDEDADEKPAKSSSKYKKKPNAEEEEFEEKSAAKSGAKSKKKSEGGEEEVVWYTDTSKEAAENRRRQMIDQTSELAAKLLLADKEKEKSDDPIENLHEFAKTNPTNEVLSAEVRKVQAEEKWNDEQVAQVMFYLLFDANVLDQLKVPSKLTLLKEFVPNDKAQLGVLAGMVMLCGKNENLRKAVPHILMALYNEDILSEEVAINWHEKKSKGDTAKVKEASTVFITWLKNAEEEGSEEEDEEEESDEE